METIDDLPTWARIMVESRDYQIKQQEAEIERLLSRWNDSIARAEAEIERLRKQNDIEAREFQAEIERLRAALNRLILDYEDEAGCKAVAARAALDGSLQDGDKLPKLP